jgi:AraC-like DNA-binding protein
MTITIFRIMFPLGESQRANTSDWSNSCGQLMNLRRPDNGLHRSAVFRTSDIEEFRAVVSRNFGATSVEVMGSPKAFEAHGSFVELKDVVILFGASSSSVTVDYPEFNFARLSIPLAGRGATKVGDETVEINKHQSCITSPGRPTQVSCGESHAWINLRVEAKALGKRLASLLGARPKGDLQFTPASNLDRPRSKSLCQLVQFLAQQLNSDACYLPPIVVEELEQAIVTAFLFANSHSFSPLLEQNVKESASWQVRRAEEHIEANWNRAINIDELAHVTGVSARALFRAFKRSRGYSPMAFVKMIRLQRARELLTAGSNYGVLGVAIRCGFSNPGHFAREYRELFGHLPSEALAKTRAI